MQNNGLFGVNEVGELLGGVFHLAYDPRVAKRVGGGFVLDHDNLGQGISFLSPVAVFQNGFIAHPQDVKSAPRRFGAMRGDVNGFAVDAPKSDARDIRDAFIDSAVCGACFEWEGQRADGDGGGDTGSTDDESEQGKSNQLSHDWMIT